MAQNELIDFLNDQTKQWDTVSISNRARKIYCFALERWNPRALGRTLSEMGMAISWRMSIEEAMEEKRSLIGEPVQ